MRTIKYFSLLLPITFLLPSLALANEFQSTLTAGYSQSDVKYMGYEPDKNPKGFNVKYRLEFNDELGVIASYTSTDYDKSVSYGSGSASLALDYQSFMFGPTFRANEVLSAYLLIGLVEGEAKGSATGIGSERLSEKDVGFGGGFQFNITDNFAIDASYEYADIEDVRVGTWTLGAGLSF